jgi:hypothetical protein
MYPGSEYAKDKFATLRTDAENTVRWSGNACVEADKRDERVNICRSIAVKSVDTVLDQMKRVAGSQGPPWSSLADVESTIASSAQAIAWLNLLESVVEQAGCKTWKAACDRISYWRLTSNSREFASRQEIWGSDSVDK